MPKEYTVGADLPDLVITTLDGSGDPIDFSTGYTFEIKVGRRGETAQFTKTTNVTGGVGSVTISWATSGELNTLTPGLWLVQGKATRGADSKHRFFFAEIDVRSAIT